MKNKAYNETPLKGITIMPKNPLNYDKNIDIFIAESKKDAPDYKVIKKQLTVAVLKSAAKGAIIGLAIGAALLVATAALSTDGIEED